MPHINLQMIPGDGPLIDIFVGVSFPRRDAMTAAGRVAPNPIRARALIDTGASCSCVDPSILQPLGVTPTGSQLIITPSTGQQGQVANQYDVSILIIKSAQHYLLVPSLPIVEAALHLPPVQGIQALIGRDVLANCLLIYDGSESQLTLSF